MGQTQSIAGAFLLVPYKIYYEDLKYKIDYFYILPKKLVIDGKMHLQVRYRGIYEAVLYDTSLHVSGYFDVLNIKNFENILWDKITFSFGLSGMRGIQENIKMHIDDKNYAVILGVARGPITQDGFSSNVALSPENSYKFSFNLKVRGS